MITRERNIILQSIHNRPFLCDVYYARDGVRKPIIIFSHGFKGFKDWGPWDIVANKFARENFVFVKFSFSHNGTTLEQPLEFADLEAFGNDNLTIEMDDLGVVIDWVCSPDFHVERSEFDTEQIYLLGHSRGGGISSLKAREDVRVKKLCTWASVNEFSKYWTKEELEKIKQDGIVYIGNARTGQAMPIKWQMYENYFANLPRLFVPDAVKALAIPMLIVHGTKDETVPVECAIEMQKWNSGSELFLVENANHNFSGRHPWLDEALPHDLKTVATKTIRFFKDEH
jgi:pimeloyl-ACP methyl ester carboxylesterase